MGGVGHALKAHDRAEQHQTTTALRAEAPAEMKTGLHHGPAIHHQHLGFAGEVAVEEGAGAAEAGGGHQQAHLPLVRGGTKLGELVVARQIQIKDAHLHAVPGAELGREGIKQRAAAGHEHQVQPRLRQAAGEGTANPGGGPGHHSPGSVAVQETLLVGGAGGCHG